jgi:hypothetical protein
MESTLLLLDCIAIVIAVLWYVRNATRAPGEPVGGLLRFRQAPRDGAARPTKPRR